jgi:hypothetical protein
MGYMSTFSGNCDYVDSVTVSNPIIYFKDLLKKWNYKSKESSLAVWDVGTVF